MANPAPHTFGLDISNTALAAVEFAVGKYGLTPVNFAHVELEPGIIEDDCIIVNPNAFRRALSALLLEGQRGPFSSREVVIGIPAGKTFSHYFAIPAEKKGDVFFIRDRAKDYIPINLEDAVMDYKFLPSASDSKEVWINFVAVRKNIVEPLLVALEEAGLNPVAVDTSVAATLRACRNPWKSAAGDFVAVRINSGETFLATMPQSGKMYSLDLAFSQQDLLENIKKALRLPTTAEAQALLTDLKKNQNPQGTETYELVRQSVQKDMERLAGKIAEMVRIIQNEENFNLSSLYLTGCYPCVPGLQETFKKFFPDVTITPLTYLNLEEGIEFVYFKAIGLALRAVMPEAESREINLLPSARQEELESKRLIPVLLKNLGGVAAALALLFVFFGMMAGKAYLEYKTNERTLKVSQEKVSNPYLNQAALENQQQTQLAGQIDKILATSLPGNLLIQRINSFNTNGISMVNASFALGADDKMDVRLRAKAASREAVEKFIVPLEKDPYFTQVISPLTNLVGREERFITVDLELNPAEIIADAHKQEEAAEKAPAKEKPALPPAAPLSLPPQPLEQNPA